MYLNTSGIRKFLLVFIVLNQFSEFVFAAEKICPLLRLANGRARYKFRGRNARFNCMRGFQLIGAKYANCMNGKWDVNLPICVKYGCLAPSKTHVNGQFIESYRGAVVKIICNPGYSLVGSPSVYCNGISWNETFPVCRVFNNRPAMSCDFEDVDLCGWRQDPMHDYDWRRKSVQMPTTEVGGPSFDKTFGLNGSGHYMHMGSFKLAMENETARLYSPVYPPELSGGSCFIFWYYMTGGNTGTLKVFLKPEDAELHSLIPSFWINGDQGEKWNLGFITVESLDTPFQIVIEGIRGSGYVSDTAFDEVKLTFGNECLNLKTTLMTSTEYSTSVGQFDDQYEDYSSPSSCRNRCLNSSSPSTNGSETRGKNCDCQEDCVQAKTCCSDFADYCQFPATSTTEWVSEAFTSSSEGFSEAFHKTHTDVYGGGPELPDNDFNKQINEIDPQKPIILMPPSNSFNRTVNKTQNESTTVSTAATTTSTTATTTTTTTEMPKSKMTQEIPVKVSEQSSKSKAINQIPKPIFQNETKVAYVKNSTAEATQWKTPNPHIINSSNVTDSGNSGDRKTQPQRNWQPKWPNESKKATEKPSKSNGGEKVETKGNATNPNLNRVNEPVNLTPRVVQVPQKPLKNPITVVSISPVERKKASVPSFPNESRFRNGKPKDFSGKESPQAIKIDKNDGTEEESLSVVLKAVGISLILAVVFVVFGIVLYLRNRNRKSERDSMVEDSDSIIYDLDFHSNDSSEYHSLVCIRPGESHRQTQI